MQEFDVVLKLLLQQAKGFLSQLAGVTIEKWLPTELPRVQNPRMDLLGETAMGDLVQLECQSTNDAFMALRMAEYSLGIYRLHGRFPLQIVLYVGRETLRMADRLVGPACSFQYRLVDLRELDSQPLLASTETSDTVLGVLTRFPSSRRTLEYIVGRVAAEPEAERRAFYLEALLLLSRLRGLEEQVEEEARRMPILNNILDNKVLGREYKRGQQEGHQEGWQEGLQEGRQEGRRLALQQLIEQRFGLLPAWVGPHLAALSEDDLSRLVARLFDVQTLAELFPGQPE